MQVLSSAILVLFDLIISYKILPAYRGNNKYGIDNLQSPETKLIGMLIFTASSFILLHC